MDDAFFDSVHDIISSEQSISFGITRAHDHLLAGRILANGWRTIVTNCLNRLKPLQATTGNPNLKATNIYPGNSQIHEL
jgi:hypothetical protein